jgi:type I restriction enzyme S subunit
MSSKTQTTATKEEATPALVPKLRFPEFRDAGGWTTETLGSVARISTEKVGENTCIPMSITSGIGLVSQMEKFGRIIAGSSYSNYLLLKKNDFAYNKSATKEYPEGFIALYSGDELAAVPNSIFTCFRIKGDSPVPQYLNYLLLGNLHGRWLRHFIEVGARAHGSLSIDEDDLLALPVPLPSGQTSLPEQQKIAECLSSVDELIAAQARKLDALKTHKKGLMQQLFPREGETQPRLRFPEFQNAGEWEEGCLADIGTVLQGYGFPERHQGLKNGDYPFYKVSDISKSLAAGKVFIEESANYINESLLKELRAKPIPEGTTIFAKIGEAIRSNKRAITTVSCLIDNNAAGVKRIKGKATDFFIYLVMEQISLIEHAGGVVPAVNKSAIEAIPVKFPEIEEQQRIADCLTSLDDLIAAQTQKHEALKTHKKGLMQQLFPSPEEVAG